jgi:hypothetical protein
MRRPVRRMSKSGKKQQRNRVSLRPLTSLKRYFCKLMEPIAITDFHNLADSLKLTNKQTATRRRFKARCFL